LKFKARVANEQNPQAAGDKPIPHAEEDEKQSALDAGVIFSGVALFLKHSPVKTLKYLYLFPASLYCGNALP
jgi:hypothetical protein